MSTDSTKRDHWSSEAYQNSAGFVPQLTSKVVSWLKTSWDHRVLDIGCGDGVLTMQLLKNLNKGFIKGLDASESMIKAAKKATDEFDSKVVLPGEGRLLGACVFEVVDCAQLETYLNGPGDFEKGSYDHVFSNAAMHWILSAPETRQSFFRGVHAALKPSGSFVFEMGGAGNVAEVHAATTAALLHFGIPLTKVREADPWFFPSEKWMTSMLQSTGFGVEKIELQYRPTQLTTTEKGGMEGWVRLMCASWLEVVEEGKREEVVRWVVEALRDSCRREEDGSWWIGYVRLRCRARKMDGGKI